MSNELETALYVIISTKRHMILKAYAVMKNTSMRNVIEEWIDNVLTPSVLPDNETKNQSSN